MNARIEIPGGKYSRLDVAGRSERDKISFPGRV